MEKCKKLSLKKRKVQATNESKMKLEANNTVGLFDDLLSPENEAEGVEISAEPGPKSTTDLGRTAAYPDDPNLQKLRELMMKISSREIENGKTLQPFPPYISGDHVSHVSQDLQKQDFNKGKQLSGTNFSVCNDELLFFPSLPDKFKQRKKQKLLEKNYNCSAGSSILVDQVKDFKKSKRDMNILLDSNKTGCGTGLSEVLSQRNMASSPPPQNSHLIRDRNSNYYSLQSQNQKQSEQKCNTLQNTTTSISGIHSSKVSDLTKSSALTKSAVLNKSSAQIDEVKNIRDNFDQCSEISISNGANKSKHADLKTTARLYSNSVKSGASGQKDLARNNDMNDSMQFSPMEEDLFSPEKETKSDILQKCPLCQQEFPRNSTQMDVDSHLAQCLSHSEDDVLW